MIPTKPTDQFPTDDWLLRVFDEWFDPCPLDENPVVDGLSILWHNRTYVNPPYSNPAPWVKKALEENKRGCTIVMLLKMDTSTKWFRDLKEAGAHFLWIGERLHHGSKYPAPFSSMLAVLS